MAYIRWSKELKDAVINKVDEMCVTAQLAYRDVRLETGSIEHRDAVECVYAQAWNDAPELRNKLPDDWHELSERVSARFLTEDGAAIAYDNGKIEGTHTYNNRPCFKLPPSRKVRGAYNLEYTIPYCDQTQEIRDFISGNVTKEAKRREIEASYTTIREQLTAFMDSHAALTTALKELPEFEMYVPERWMRKVRAAQQPRQAKAVVSDAAVEVDVGKLTSAAVAYKLTAVAS